MRKMCKDQKETLIGKLATLFSGVSADKTDEVATDTKARLTSENKEAKNREHLNAFDQQMKTLLDKGYPEAAGMEKSQFLEYVNPLRDKFKIGDLIVIPERIVSIPKQMSMVKLNDKTGYTHLNLGVLTQADGVETPNVPYLIRDVENGSAYRNTSPYNCVKQFKKQERFELTAEEGIAIVTHKPETLNDHYIDLPGSRYGSDGVPGLWLSGSRQPMLRSGWADCTHLWWGSASCGSRIRA